MYENYLTNSRFGTFSPFSVLSINFLVLPNNFIVSGICISRLYPHFISNTIFLFFNFFDVNVNQRIHCSGLILQNKGMHGVK